MASKRNKLAVTWTTSLATCALALLLLSGCQPGSTRPASLAGRWKGTLEAPQSPTNKPVDKFGEALSFDLELREDKTFSLQLAFFPMEGDWNLSGNTLTLTPTKLMGMSANTVTEHNGARMSTETEPLELAVSPDGSTLTLHDKKESAGEIVFVRTGEGALAKL